MESDEFHDKIILLLTNDRWLEETLNLFLASREACVDTIWDGGLLDGVICSDKHAARIGDRMIEAIKSSRGSVVIIFSDMINTEILFAPLFRLGPENGLRVNAIVRRSDNKFDERLAEIVAFLLSPASHAFNGEVLEVGDQTWLY